MLFFSMLLTACKKKDNAIPAVDYSYFPQGIGHYVIYDVDSVVHDDFAKTTTTFRFQIKEVIESTFPDNSGRPVQRVEKYKRENASVPWRFQLAFTMYLGDNKGERFENNRRYISLTFPPELNRPWSSPSYDGNDTWSCKYTSIDQPLTLGNNTMASTVTVTQIDEENLIKKEYSVEKYAKNIGLVYKEYIKDSSNVIPNPPVPLKDRISGGLEYKMTLNSYGQ